MRKVLMGLLLIGVSLTGCSAIKQQYNQAELMKTYVFNAPAAKVYAAASDVLAEAGTQITSTGDNRGASEWDTLQHDMGAASYMEKVRISVSVITVSDSQSKVRVFKQSVPLKSTFKGGSQRQLFWEFRILQRVDAVAASKIEASAANM